MFSDEDIAISELPFATMLSELRKESIDWWRQVSCVLFKEDKLLLTAVNRYRPTMHAAEIDGDMRSNGTRGVAIELSNAEHAEARAIAEAAKRGIALNGASLCVSTFPCPVCAKLIATAELKRSFFRKDTPLGMVKKILRAEDIKIHRVIETTERF